MDQAPPPGTERLAPVALARQLLALHRTLAAAERNLLDAQSDLATARQVLTEKETEAWALERVTGRNAEERAACLLGLTNPYRLVVAQTEAALRARQSEHRVVLEELKSLRAMLRALGSAEE
jgi:hypothetical protein